MSSTPVFKRPEVRLMVVEDNETLRKHIVRALTPVFGSIVRFGRGDDAVLYLSDEESLAPDVVVTDLRLPGADGLSVLHAARKRNPNAVILLMTAFGSIETAVSAMREGAVDFLQKPFELSELEVRVERALEHLALVEEVQAFRSSHPLRCGKTPVIGENSEFQKAIDIALRVAPTRATVLLTGETGTGKEIIASLIHQESTRSSAPFVKVNCAALPETLLESELFGHEKGAFTSADRTRIGRFEQADGGTLFLDEVGDMSLATQAKLLRVLQEQEFHRLGGTETLRTDVRVISATNRDLRRAIEDGDFREDLYFRLNVISVHLPALRDRVGDIPALALHFLSECRQELSSGCIGLKPDALRRLSAHSWPGNIRELRNVMERTVLLCEGESIGAADLQLEVRHQVEQEEWHPGLPAEGLAWEDAERALVKEALEYCGWVQKDAALFLGISRRKLNYMIQRMGLKHPSWRRNRSLESS